MVQGPRRELLLSEPIIQNATHRYEDLSAAESQHQIQPNGALGPGILLEARCSVEPFFCYTASLYLSTALLCKSLITLVKEKFSLTKCT